MSVLELHCDDYKLSSLLFVFTQFTEQFLSFVCFIFILDELLDLDPTK